MGDASSEPVELYRARGPAEAHAIRIHLEEAGIIAHIDNQMLQGVVGEIPGGWTTALRILVARADLEAAQTVLNVLLSQVVEAEKTRDATDSRCLACREPMGESETCASCGWSFRPDLNQPTESGTLPAKEQSLSPDETRVQKLSQPRLPSTGQAGWGEVTAVLCVGVFPAILSVITCVGGPTPYPYWADTLDLTGISAFTIFVTLYLIRRSGESWSRFGLSRPNGWDLPLGMLILLVAEMIWFIQVKLHWYGHDPSSTPQFPAPRDTAERWMMVGKYLVSAFSEELVCRAYLITRLEVLLRSRGWAVLLSAVAFSSYHAYQGITGVVFTLLLGLAYGAIFLATRRIWPLAIGHALADMQAELGY